MCELELCINFFFRRNQGSSRSFQWLGIVCGDGNYCQRELEFALPFTFTVLQELKQNPTRSFNTATEQHSIQCSVLCLVTQLSDQICLELPSCWIPFFFLKEDVFFDKLVVGFSNATKLLQYYQIINLITQCFLDDNFNYQIRLSICFFFLVRDYLFVRFIGVPPFYLASLRLSKTTEWNIFVFCSKKKTTEWNI